MNQRVKLTRSASLKVSRNQVKLRARHREKVRNVRPRENLNRLPMARRVSNPDNAVAAQIVAGPAARAARAATEETSKALKNWRANSVMQDGPRRRRADR